MALPLSRNTNYALGVPVRSVDLNDMQDCIIGGRHGPVELTIGFLELFPPQTATGWVHDGAGHRWNTNLQFNLFGQYPIRLPVGKRLLSWSLRLNKASAATAAFVATLRELDELNFTPFTTIGAAQSNSAAAPGAITLGQSGLAASITAGRQYMVKIELNGSGAVSDFVGSLKITFDHP